MTAQDFVSKLRGRFLNSPLRAHEALLVARIVFHEFADSIYSLRLRDGQHIADGIDSAAICREIVAVIEAQELDILASHAPSACHTCGHPHASGEECGVDMGGAGKCGCKAAVPA
ncbi:MAG TPA: hypothetical protein VKP61_00690 [Candidatus Acidoferrum sp.]|nr:hypothetical protein [Candidatus Acidoferrum sp.]